MVKGVQRIWLRLNEMEFRSNCDMRFLFYSHDGLGLGHTRRHLAVAAALSAAAPDAAILIASGADDAGRWGLPPQVEVLKLPGLRKSANDQYDSRRLPIPTSETRALRSALLLTTVNTFRPNVALVDKHPFGARGEFRAALDALKDFGGHAVLGLRDILDERATVLKEWAPYNLQSLIAESYDQVLVYGDRAVFDPVTEYDFPKALAERTVFCGYVVNGPDCSGTEDRWMALNMPNQTKPLVLATAGGGEDGFQLLQKFARATSGAPWQGAIVAGPMTPAAEFATLQSLAAEAGVSLHHFVPNLSSLLSSVDALVCMGGYNTLAEAVSTGVPTICVPRITPRSEQLIRAKAFEGLGLVTAIGPEELTTGVLREAIESALKLSRQALRHRAHACLNFDGARQAASHLLALAAAKSKLAEAS